MAEQSGSQVVPKLEAGIRKEILRTTVWKRFRNAEEDV